MRQTYPYSDISLRLQTSVTNHILWAYNSRHLQFLRFLREYIQATDRRPHKRRQTAGGWLPSNLVIEQSSAIEIRPVPQHAPPISDELLRYAGRVLVMIRTGHFPVTCCEVSKHFEYS